MDTKRIKTRAIAWLMKKLDAVPRQYHLSETARFSANHACEIVRERDRVDALISKLTRLTWSRDMDVYKVGIAFDARMMHGYSQRADLDFLAEMIARQVRAEIASARFVQKADGWRPY